jgi:hypothetical protein
MDARQNPNCLCSTMVGMTAVQRRHMRIRRNSVISKLHPDHTHSDRSTKSMAVGQEQRTTVCVLHLGTKTPHPYFTPNPRLSASMDLISSGWRRVTTLPYTSLDESMAGRTGTKQMPRSMVHGSADLELVVFIRSSNGARTYIGTTALALAVAFTSLARSRRDGQDEEDLGFLRSGRTQRRTRSRRTPAAGAPRSSSCSSHRTPRGRAGRRSRPHRRARR